MGKHFLQVIITAVILTLGHVVSAQVVEGNVKYGGSPIPGVNVVVEGTSYGVITDVDGSFTLNNVAEDATIVFSFVGLKTIKLPAKFGSPMNVTMKDDTETLKEVVVIGFGTQKREDLTGAISSITVEEIQDQPFTSIDQALVGQAAGVNVTQNSGTPGGGISVQIRGITSINGNEPLYVIDGTPVFPDRNNESFSFGLFGGGDGQTRNSALAGLNISDIESIDILKDASATAIYGANGANGVVLITTKKGKRGKAVIGYESYVGIQENINFVDVLDLPDYARYQTKLLELNGEPIPFQYQTPELLGSGTNWQKEIFRAAPIQNHQLSVSGGNEDTRYYTSVGYFDQEGTILNSDFNRLSLRVNVDSKVKEWLKIGNNLSINRSFQRVVRNDDRGGLVMNSLRQSPELPVRYSDGSFAGPVGNLGSGGNEATNPVALAEINNATTQRSQLLGNLFAEIKFVEGLTFKSELGYDLGFGKIASFAPAFELGAITETLNRSFKQQEQSYYWNIKNYLTYNKTFGEKHNLTVLIGQEAQESRYEYLSGFRTGQFLSKDFPNLDLGDIETAENGNGSGRWAMTSYISRVIYGYGDKYSLSASVRADASSNFGPNNRWGYFPSVSGGWTISNEKFLSENGFVDNLRLRAGYGSVGNQNIPANRFQTILSLVPSPFGGNSPTIDNLGNPDIKWESLNSFNVGIDAAVLNNKIQLTADYYVKNSSDFLARRINDESNQSAQDFFINTGVIETKGLELSLTTNNIATQDFFWKTTAIFSTYTNELTSFQGQGQSLLGRVQFDQFTITRTTEGEPVGQFYGFVTDGIYRSEEELAAGPFQEDGTAVGDIRFKDLNNDNVIDGKDQAPIGNAIPDFTYSLINNLEYKNFSLAITLQGSQGNDIYNFTRHYIDGIVPGFGDRFSNVTPRALNAFELGVNEDTNEPRLTLTDPNGNGRISDRFVEDGSYLRIQNVMLSYNVPSGIIGNGFFSRIRVYASVQNLYTFTKYSGFDPSLGSLDQNVTLNGIDLGRFPVPRISSVGLNLEF
ncbi:SusC/RagA family TonB-linked outer membrane protein [Marivirga lumbricoides]|uniref:SusC/RagA family TonB-linked outer membrane protein n=1 Tax=Marivirga lumbricoides TaxID=1046115 RepID=A0ABQ1LZI6_9BACT|nr:SusC/RagA family TonB-linked outer membrane protein [Marivirga lumbricoides]